MLSYYGRKFLIGVVSGTLLSTAAVSVSAANKDTYHLLDSQGNPVVTHREEECVITPRTPNVPTKMFKKCGDILDRDKDGVPDNEDRCPDNTAAEIAKGVYDNERPPRRPINRPTQRAEDRIGCPIDTDGDTVSNFEDVCINTLQRLVEEDRRRGIGTCIHMSGINLGCDIDTDGDGTPDCFDDCLDPNKDSDQDGIPDCFDTCPGTPLGRPVNTVGCYKDKVYIPNNVLFDFDRWNLRRPRVSGEKGGAEILNDLIYLITTQVGIDNIERIHVLGYTDNIGTNRYNLTLSKKRARTVAKYLRSHLGPNVASRISYEGKGKHPECLKTYRPTPEERQYCRRVDLEMEPPIVLTPKKQ